MFQTKDSSAVKPGRLIDSSYFNICIKPDMRSEIAYEILLKSDEWFLPSCYKCFVTLLSGREDLMNSWLTTAYNYN